MSESIRPFTAVAEQLYCGCCGNEIGNSTRSDPDWCKHCSPHIKRYTNAPPWQRTYAATYHRDCPYQVPTVAANDRLRRSLMSEQGPFSAALAESMRAPITAAMLSQEVKDV
jgi:hypothetical protein